MFYEASLLSKTGPLARVWLASNLDRKLTKQNVMQANLETNVKDIIGENQAPLALRLSGQLLLGVVKIYNRKAKYLMDDCSDALLKIKMVRWCSDTWSFTVLTRHRLSGPAMSTCPQTTLTRPTRTP